MYLNGAQASPVGLLPPYVPNGEFCPTTTAARLPCGASSPFRLTPVPPVQSLRYHDGDRSLYEEDIR